MRTYPNCKSALRFLIKLHKIYDRWFQSDPTKDGHIRRVDVKVTRPIQRFPDLSAMQGIRFAPLWAERDMPMYRIYPLNEDGRIRAPAALANCGDDDGALAVAFRLLTGSEEAEIWAGARCLGRISVSSAERWP